MNWCETGEILCVLHFPGPIGVSRIELLPGSNECRYIYMNCSFQNDANLLLPSRAVPIEARKVENCAA